MPIRSPFISVSVEDTSLNHTLLTNPGPGAYGNPSMSNLKSAPSCRQGTSKKCDLVDPELKKVPGPGSYKITTTIGEGPKSQMGQRTSANSIF